MKNAIVMKKNSVKAVKKRTVKATKKNDMEKSVAITYSITNPGKRAADVLRTIEDELKCIHDAIGDQIGNVVINFYQSGKEFIPVPMTLENQLALQTALNIGNIKINSKYRKGKSNRKSPTPEAVLEKLRELHDQLGDQISDIEDDPEDAASGLEDIYTEMETQLDALEEAFDDE